MPGRATAGSEWTGRAVIGVGRATSGDGRAGCATTGLSTRRPVGAVVTGATRTAWLSLDGVAGLVMVTGTRAGSGRTAVAGLRATMCSSAVRVTTGRMNAAAGGRTVSRASPGARPNRLAGVGATFAV